MKKIIFSQKISSIKKAAQFQHKLIDSISSIILLKRKSQNDYMVSLQLINKELESYINQENGFLTQIIKSYQSYISVIYQNKKALIEGYDNQILQFLQKCKDSKMQFQLLERVEEFNRKNNEYQNNIVQFKRLIKDYEMEMTLLNSQITLSNRIEKIDQARSKEYVQKYKAFKVSKDKNLELLQNEVNKMMELTMAHNIILKDLQEYETTYLQNKGLQVFDNFKRAFVLEVSFIRNMQFDIGTILTKINQGQKQSKTVALDLLRKSMNKHQYKVSQFIKQTYKNMTNLANTGLDIKQVYINQKIRSKWKRICEYYNQAY